MAQAFQGVDGSALDGQVDVVEVAAGRVVRVVDTWPSVCTQ